MDPIVNHMPAAYVCLQVTTGDPGQPADYQVLEANPAFEVLTGQSLETMKGQNLSLFFNNMKASPRHWRHSLEQAARGHASQGFTLQDQKADRWYQGEVYGDKPGFLSVLFWDVTHFIKQQEVLERENRLLEGVFNAIPDVLAIKHPDLSIERYNKAGYQLLGLTPEEVKGKKCHQLIGQQVPCDVCMSRKTLTTGTPETNELYVPGLDQYIECTATLLSNQEKQVIGVVELLRNITKQKQATDQLKAREEYLSTILETTKDGFWVVNREGHITDVNQAYCTMSGYTADELKTMVIQDIDMVETPDMTRNRMKRIYARGWDIFETRHRKKDGSPMEVEVSVTCADPLVGELVCFCRDITQRKQQEQKLHQAIKQAEAANKAKNQYLAHMNHEIRTPLSGLIGFLNMMENTRLDQEQQEFMYHMKRAAIHLMSIVNNVLDHAKIEAGEIRLTHQLFNLEEEVTMALSPLRSLAKEKNLALGLMLSKDLPRQVVGDPQRMRQVILNLGSNAIKFTDAGQVNISVSCSETDADHHLLKLLVDDTGIGMGDTTLEKVFQPFYQGAEQGNNPLKGTGLGMSITRELVELMGGTIKVDSALGKGTRVEVQIRLEKVKNLSATT